MKLVSSPSKDGEMTSKPNSSSPLVNATKTTRLSFSGNDEVREIPRIGLTRVPPRPTSTLRPSEFAKSHPRQRRRPPPVVAPPIPAVPIEESVFRGILKERNAAIVDDGDGVVDARCGRGAAAARRRGCIASRSKQRLERESVSWLKKTAHLII